MADEIELSFNAEEGRSVVRCGSLSEPYINHVGDMNRLSAAGLDDGVIPVTVEHDHEAHYPGEEGHVHKGKELERATNSLLSVVAAGVDSFKYLYSMGLLIFSVIVVMAAMFTEQSKGTAEKDIHVALSFFTFWFLVVWLAMMEGGQGALVGLQPIDKSLYAESHSKSLKCTKLTHEGDNMERFIVGRQFLVVLVVFATNLLASAVEGANVLGLSNIVAEIFLEYGVAVMLTTIMLGQLTAQVNAAHCMLDFINTYFMLLTTYVSLVIEYSGLLHSVYLVQILFSTISGTPIDSKEPPRSSFQNLLFWGRILMSLALLGIAFAVTLTALFEGKTAMWDGVPPYVSVILFFILMALVGMMEGMQIALFAVVNMPEEKLQKHSIARKNCQLAFTGQNLQSFLIGRQICVTICMFVIARITTLVMEDGDGNLFGVSDGLEKFFHTGLLGALVTTIVGSLAWRIIASSFPMTFLSNPLIYVIIRLCLILEASGVCSAVWLLAIIHKKLAGYQPDEVYIGTAEERAAATKELELSHENKVEV